MSDKVSASREALFYAVTNHTTADPHAVVRINCERCGRAGSYRKDKPMARFGADIAVPDLLVGLASYGAWRGEPYIQPPMRSGRKTASPNHGPMN